MSEYEVTGIIEGGFAVTVDVEDEADAEDVAREALRNLGIYDVSIRSIDVTRLGD